MKSILKIITNVFSISFILTFTLILNFIHSSTKDIDTPAIEEMIYNNVTTVYDKNDELILLLGEDKNNEVTFEEIPEVFINALISAEDSKFILHNGVDPTRLASALFSNIKNGSINQGGSTLTQQLVKNLFLDNEQTLKRKLKEAYIAIKLEKNMSKEEIFTTYVNRICFDGTTIGVNSASIKFFSKDISMVTLPEAALLAGMVNAPTLYNPIINPTYADKRKNVVLDLMVRHGYITKEEANVAKNINTSSLINLTTRSEPTYQYQAYLDVVYTQVLELTGLDPFLVPMKIHTYMDISTQNIIDNIQGDTDSVITFEDDNQQFATTVIENSTGHIIAIGGGRNYSGQRLYNRAYNMKQQPASTIKPLIYALAIEEFNWNSNQLLLDQSYIYPGTDKEVKNADKTNMGELLLSDALGYSRNTTALYTFENLINTLGKKEVYDYFNSIGMMDTSLDLFNLAYGIGGYYNGVSPIDLAGAYSMLANRGIYNKPTTIKRIELSDGKVIEPNSESKQILSEESSFIISSVLDNVVKRNYWGIGSIAIDKSSIAAKTGTSNYDNAIAQVYNYPSNASKDIWVSGYSPDYTISVWTGFDKPEIEKQNYFKASGDTRAKMAKKIFSRLMNYLTNTPITFNVPQNIAKVNVVKGTNLLPDEYTPSSMIVESFYKKEYIPTNYIHPDNISEIEEINYVILDDRLILHPTLAKQDYSKTIFSYSRIYGDTQTMYKITDPNGNIEYVVGDDLEKEYLLQEEGEYIIEAYNKYSNIDTYTSESKISSFYYINEKEGKDDFFSFPFNYF